jgi:hypothetical protein
MGHVAIDEMKLPVLGREEDEADAFATLRLLKIGSDFSQRVLAEASKNRFLAGRRDQETGAEPVYYGEHRPRASSPSSRPTADQNLCCLQRRSENLAGFARGFRAVGILETVA